LVFFGLVSLNTRKLKLDFAGLTSYLFGLTNGSPNFYVENRWGNIFRQGRF